ncbi:hypothetical protein DEU56DRAFT_913743 [Suillus clintonianus]|uniref:uncharacterized protein n=1 Tax=Suillus clintonianus TaxID=1904413 RepID=UPI001B85F693|nr:uncharacterized protein DEU56DRAFT_913743 [Suillus clintonianus]KAG2134073.1 hypothetical protein DEU56DRAFT_913743 [Suillus clintonianus]
MSCSSPDDIGDFLSVVRDEKVVSAVQDVEHARLNSSERKKLQLSLYDDDEIILRSFFVRKSIDGKYGVLLWRDSEQEVVFDVQGLLAKFMLPPLSRQRYGSTQRPLLLRQNATLLAATDSFGRSSSALGHLFRFFEQQFGQGQVRPWSPVNMGVAEAISADTRYVSPRSELSLWSDALPQLQEFPLLDKNNVIRNWVEEGNVAFTEDNFVDYSEVVSGGGVSRRTPADPSIFRVGQIVELGLSLKVVRTRQSSSQYSFLVHMDNLLLLNRSPSMLLANLETLRQSVKALDVRHAMETHALLPKKRRVREDDMFEFEKLLITRQFSRLALEGSSGQPEHSSVSEYEVSSGISQIVSSPMLSGFSSSECVEVEDGDILERNPNPKVMQCKHNFVPRKRISKQDSAIVECWPVHQFSTPAHADAVNCTTKIANSLQKSPSLAPKDDFINVEDVFTLPVVDQFQTASSTITNPSFPGQAHSTGANAPLPGFLRPVNASSSLTGSARPIMIDANISPSGSAHPANI